MSNSHVFALLLCFFFFSPKGYFSTQSWEVPICKMNKMLLKTRSTVFELDKVHASEKSIRAKTSVKCILIGSAVLSVFVESRVFGHVQMGDKLKERM